MSTDLVSWLRSQLDADEQTARTWIGRHCDGCGAVVAARGLFGLVKCTECDSDELPLVHDPTLRTVAAHRAILDDYAAIKDAAEDPSDEATSATYAVCLRVLDLPIRRLASIYEDRPGFDPSWRANG